MATERPARESVPWRKRTLALIPWRTPKAVTGEGSPLPPWAAETPVTQGVSV